MPEKLEPTQWNLGSKKKAVCDGCVLQSSVQKRQLSMREYWKMFVGKDSVCLAWQGEERWAWSTRQRKYADWGRAVLISADLSTSQNKVKSIKSKIWCFAKFTELELEWYQLCVCTTNMKLQSMS